MTLRDAHDDEIRILIGADVPDESASQLLNDFSDRVVVTDDEHRRARLLHHLGSDLLHVRLDRGSDGDDSRIDVSELGQRRRGLNRSLEVTRYDYVHT